MAGVMTLKRPGKIRFDYGKDSELPRHLQRQIALRRPITRYPRSNAGRSKKFAAGRAVSIPSVT